MLHLVAALVVVYLDRMTDISNPALYPTVIEHDELSTDAYMTLPPASKAFVDAYLATLGSSARAASIALSDAVGRAKDVPMNDRARAMMRLPKVQLAIKQRARELSAKFEVDANTLLKEITNIAMSNMGNYVHIDADGLPYFDFRHVTVAQMSAVKTITVEELPETTEERIERLGDGGFGKAPKLRKKIKLELHDKQNAQEKLMRFLQLYAPERLEINHRIEQTVVTANMTPEQLAKVWSERLKQ